jgi:hypothetical protein
MQYGEHYYFFLTPAFVRALSDLGRIHGADVAQVLNFKRHHHQWSRAGV